MNGDITVFDFNNACFCWYLYDLETLWKHGVGWIQFEPDPGKRRDFMCSYFDTILEGYVSKTPLEQKMLDRLPLFIDVNIMENIVDAFEVIWRDGVSLECDGEQTYLIRCLEEEIPYEGFFAPPIPVRIPLHPSLVKYEPSRPQWGICYDSAGPAITPAKSSLRLAS